MIPIGVMASAFVTPPRMYANLIRNGRIDTADYWTPAAGTSWTVGNGVLTYLDVLNSKAVSQTLQKPVPSGHVMYARVDCSIATGNTWFLLGFDGVVAFSSSSDYASRPSGRYSFIGSHEVNRTMLHISGRTASTGPFTIDNVLLLDLTDTFGAGNEPTKEWCDTNITDEQVIW